MASGDVDTDARAGRGRLMAGASGNRGGERRRGDTGQRGLFCGCGSDLVGPGVRVVAASGAAGGRTGVVEEESVSDDGFCAFGVGMGLRLRTGLMDDCRCCCCICCCSCCLVNDGERVRCDDADDAGPDPDEAAVATFMAVCERAEGRAGEDSRDANGDALADVAADAVCEDCACACVCSCCWCVLRIDDEDDSRVSVGCGLYVWLAGAPFTALDGLSIVPCGMMVELLWPWPRLMLLLSSVCRMYILR